MRKPFFFCILTILVLTLAGCGGGDDHHSEPPPLFEAVILSAQPADGDIAYDPFEDTFTITNGPDTLFFGIDETNLNLPEFRAFLDFPLDGSTGGDVVPASARIVAATLEIFIDSVSFEPIVPTLLDLISYPIDALRVEDFNSTPLLTQSLDFFASDQGRFVAIDVTPLMQEAQRLGVTDFQVRFLLDLAADAGLVGIEDLPNVTASAPLLFVLYEP